MRFETFAVDIDTGKVLGGVKWGYDVPDAKGSQIIPRQGQQSDFSLTPSTNWQDAVDKWNAVAKTHKGWSTFPSSSFAIPNHHYSRVTILMLLSVVIWKQRGHMHQDMKYQEALDPSIYIGERIQAASTLRDADIARLKLKLMSDLPGRWDKSALDAIALLGEIGDDDTVKFLQRLDRVPTQGPGKFHGAVIEAVRKIKMRQSDR